MTIAFETQHPRHGDGRFQPTPHSNPEVALDSPGASELAETVRDLLENSAEHYNVTASDAQLDDIAAYIRSTLAT